MSMDLIAGTIILTSVFLVVVGVTTLGAGRLGDDMVSRSEGARRRKLVLMTMLIVYFLGITNVFIITQQHTLAFLNIGVGIVLAGFQFFSGASPATESDVTPATRPEEIPNPSPSNR
jgi:hypothetical protein